MIAHMLKVLPCLFVAVVPTSADDIRFPQDIQPILARKCYACHGPDEETREADLRLDSREAAVKGGAIDVDKLSASELLARVLSDDPDTKMPPPDSRETLTDADKENLKRWVIAGAKYQQHWAFIPPARTQPPSIPTVRNPIDRFVLDRLKREQLKPAVPADRFTLVRRLYLDLIGLPPTLEQADAFVNDSDPQAYEKLVDRLLQSKQYGERWARLWLDLARYADTNGYEKDRERSIWPYRDWVIKAINADMPFDQFSVEQLAGDMLPAATVDQRIATGFHRNTMLNEEGGIDPLEYRFYSVVDRVGTTGTVWMGLTIGCAQCHTHKYDPVLHTDFYSFMALMNNADEPDLILPDLQKTNRLRTQIEALEAALPDRFPPDNGAGTELERRRRAFEKAWKKFHDIEHAWATNWTTLRPSKLWTNLPRLRVLEDDSILSTGDITKRDVYRVTLPLSGATGPITALRLEVLPDDRLPARGPGRTFYEGRKGDFFLSELSATHDGAAVPFASGSQSYGKLSIGSGKFDAAAVFDGEGSTGWSTAGQQGEPHELVLKFDKPIAASGELTVEMLFERHFAASLGRFRFSVTNKTEYVRASAAPPDVRAILLQEEADVNQQKLLASYYATIAPELAQARTRLTALKRQLAQVSYTMVLQERLPDNPRKTFRHHRGEYLSPREKVDPGVPEVLGVKQQPRNRLEMARWLVSDENPLVARVTVNRAWRAFFGTGIVKTSGDFGTQSDPPSHPALLDWLANEFMQQGWSVKKLHRLIVTSATYQQSSKLVGESVKRDPENRLLARGPRFRVDAEMVRDVMLASSGLLSSKMYGPGVYPPQPASVTALAYGGMKWNDSRGEDRYRRSLYTFTKRTAPFAAFAVFDGPSGENCLARRNRSNTPLQALTLLNDEMFLEMARAAAKTIVAADGQVDTKATLLFRRFLTRVPTRVELSSLVEFYDAQMVRLSEGVLNAKQICGDNNNSLAAWTLVARAVMNLDEVITRN
jgi:hypothetical protein